MQRVDRDIPATVVAAKPSRFVRVSDDFLDEVAGTLDFIESQRSAQIHVPSDDVVIRAEHSRCFQ